MKGRLLIILFLVSIIIVACTHNDNMKSSNSSININNQHVKTKQDYIAGPNPKIDIFNTTKGDFYLGMKKDDVIKKIKELKLDSKITDLDDTYINVNSDDKLSFYLRFDTKDNNTLTDIHVKNIPSSSILKKGDSASKIIELYGDQYTLYENNYKFHEDNGSYSTTPAIYEFKLNDHYFRVYVKNQKVLSWEISQFKIEKNITVVNKTISPNLELTSSDLENMSKSDLSILRNYYYAIHGYKFKDKFFMEFFSLTKWYIPKYDNVDKFLTETDIENINLILDFEESK